MTERSETQAHEDAAHEHKGLPLDGHRWHTAVPDWTQLREAAVRLERHARKTRVEIVLGIGENRADVRILSSARVLSRTPPAHDVWRTDPRTRLLMTRRHAPLGREWEVHAQPVGDAWHWQAHAHDATIPLRLEARVRKAIPSERPSHPLLGCAARLLRDQAAELRRVGSEPEGDTHEALLRYAAAAEGQTPAPPDEAELEATIRLQLVLREAERTMRATQAIVAGLRAVPDLPGVPGTVDTAGLLESIEHTLTHAREGMGPDAEPTAADALAGEDSHEEAVDDLESIIEADPDDTHTRYALAAVHLNRAQRLLER